MPCAFTEPRPRGANEGGPSDSSDVMRGFIAQNPLFLAPMAGWTDVVFRTICREFGAGLACTEMVSAQGLAHDGARTWAYLEVSPEEAPAVVQLFGSEPDVIAAQAARIQHKLGGALAAIDINMGCPAHKVVRKGEGSALMCQPQLAAQIVRQTVCSVSVPVTVKFRRGFETGDETAVEFADRMQDAGAAALCVHGRYARDFYRGTADWQVIARVKQQVGVPVLASGDLFTPRDIALCLAQTGADGVAIARGAQGNPWIFTHTRQLMQHLAAGGSLDSWQQPRVPLSERLRVARLHVRRLAQRDPFSVVHMRTYFAPYFKGVPGASVYRGQVMQCKTLDDFEAFFDALWADALEHGLVEEGQGDEQCAGAAAGAGSVIIPADRKDGRR